MSNWSSEWADFENGLKLKVINEGGPKICRKRRIWHSPLLKLLKLLKMSEFFSTLFRKRPKNWNNDKKNAKKPVQQPENGEKVHSNSFVRCPKRHSLKFSGHLNQNWVFYTWKTLKRTKKKEYFGFLFKNSFNKSCLDLNENPKFICNGS